MTHASSTHLSRRETLQAVTAAGALAAAGLGATSQRANAASDTETSSNTGGFWPNGALACGTEPSRPRGSVPQASAPTPPPIPRPRPTQAVSGPTARALR